MKTSPRVVVTGVGLVSPLGLDESSLWDNMLAGRTAIAPLRSCDTSELRTRIGAEVDDTALLPALAALDWRPFDRTSDMAILAAHRALSQAGLLAPIDSPDPLPMAVIVGTAEGSNKSLGVAYKAFHEKGVRGLRPTTVPRCMANAVSSQVSMKFRLVGPNYVVVSACAASTTAIGLAFRMIHDGHSDLALCGGSDASFDPFSVASWNNLGVMSRNPDPIKACRPFDRDRDGCVLGEGAAFLVLESLERARSRGARIRAEIAGFGESSDASHITHPSPEGQAGAIANALQSAGIRPSDVGLINAHGTATQANDESESRSIRLAFGDAADRIPVLANKSFFGHLLGASGALETIVTILSLEKGITPPNLNLDDPDPACGNLLFVRNAPHTLDRLIAVKNSFGFGGNNAVLVIRKS